MTILEIIKFEEDWLSEVNLTKENIKIAFAGIRATALESQRWIPVSERLPEEQTTIGEYVFSKNVLGTEGFTIRKAYYNYTTKEWFDGNEEMEWTGITHWMPLPKEPYMTESEDEK